MCTSAPHPPLYVKTGVMKNIFLIGMAVIYVTFLSRHRVLHPFLFLYFCLIVFIATTTSFSTAPDSEFIRTGEQSLPMAAQAHGAPDRFPHSHLSPFPRSHSPPGAAAEFPPSQKGRQADSCHAMNQISNCGLEGKPSALFPTCRTKSICF